MPGQEVLSPRGSLLLQLLLKLSDTSLLTARVCVHTQTHTDPDLPVNTDFELCLFFNPACVIPGFSLRDSTAGEGRFWNVMHLSLSDMPELAQVRQSLWEVDEG